MAQDLEEEGRRREDQKREQDRMEKQWEVEAASREKRKNEEKQKAEEDKKAKEDKEKKRRGKLGNAFAMDDDDDDADRQKREADQLRKAGDKKRAIMEVTAGGGSAIVRAVGDNPNPKGDKELAKKLGFDGALDPAEAFLRLQERKRKGRSHEFGGPPRGASPWRDGKKGVITPIALSRMEYEEKAREKRVADRKRSRS